VRAVTIASMLGVLACRPVAPVSEPDSPPVVFGEKLQPVAEPPSEAFEPIRKGACPAEVGMVPTAFFEDRVLVRLPGGLDDSNLIEVGPTLARSSDAVESVDCRPDAGRAKVLAAAVSLRQTQPDMSLEQVREHVVAEFGYPDDYVILEAEREPDSGRGMWVVALKTGDGSTTRALIVLKSSSGFVAAMMFEASVEDWPALVDSFVESGNRLLVVPG
jgi:hypothetical protein